MSDSTPAGPLVDALGVTVAMDAHDRLTDVLLIGKTIDLEDGSVGLVISASDDLDWISQAGLLDIARRLVASGHLPDLD